MSDENQQSDEYLLSDKPDWEGPKWQGLEDLAIRIVGLIDELPTSPPGLFPEYPILVTGDWGTGKTTLLRGIQHALDEQHGCCRSIWFEAWRYEGCQPLLPALIRTVWESIPKEVQERDKIKKVASKAVGIAWQAAKQFGPAVLGGLGIPGMSLVLREDVQKVAGKAWSIITAEDSVEPTADQLEQLRTQLGKMLEAGWPEIRVDEDASGVDTTKFPVVFIDDLDRCSPDNAIALLEQVRTLVADGGRLPCHFVVAMDRSVLVHLVSNKYRGLGRYDGNRYLEKVFPLAFSVPRPNRDEAARLVAALYLGGRVPHVEETGIRTEAELEQLNALTEVLMQPMFANPRLMKRCINRFRLVRTFEGGNGADVQGDSVLIRWLAATERWPRMRRLLSDHDDRYWHEIGTHITQADAPSPGPATDEVLSEKGAREWITRQVFTRQTPMLTVYREADRRLRRWGL